MIGNEKVSLVQASGGVYADIQRDILASPEHELWFGPMSARKMMRRTEENGAATGVPFLVAIAGLFLFIDAFGDTASAWNPFNELFFSITVGFLVFAFIVSIVAVQPADETMKRHRLIVRLGDRVNIGIGDIWQDSRNGICTIDCSLLSAFRGRKLGPVATRLMIRKCFSDLGARRIESSALSTNPASVKMNDRMLEEGVMKHRYIIRGQPVDEHLYRLLKSEWLEQLAASNQPAHS